MCGFDSRQLFFVTNRCTSQVPCACARLNKPCYTALNPHKITKHLNSLQVKTKVWLCSRCSFEDDSRQLVSQHLQVHLTSASYMCKECGDTFASKDALTRHFAEEHDFEEGREDAASYETMYQASGVSSQDIEIQVG